MSTTPTTGQDVREWRRLRAWELHQAGWRGKDIAAALAVSAGAVSGWLKHDLVDDLWCKIIPITLGEGKHLFQDGTSTAVFTLETMMISPSGVIVANYRRARKVTTGSF